MIALICLQRTEYQESHLLTYIPYFEKIEVGL
jgi:hypothetical protein